MHTGQTTRTQNRYRVKSRPLTVPQLVNSSRTSFLGTYQPIKRQVKNPPTGNMTCPVTKSKTSNRGFPNSVRPSTAPNDSEKNVPITQHDTVTMAAPALREILSSSKKKAVDTSWREMSDVMAARAV